MLNGLGLYEQGTNRIHFVALDLMLNVELVSWFGSNGDGWYVGSTRIGRYEDVFERCMMKCCTFEDKHILEYMKHLVIGANNIK